MSRISQITDTSIDWLFADFESRTSKWARTSGSGDMTFPAVSGYGNVMRIVSPGSGDVEVHRNFTPSYGSNCFKGFTSIDLDIDLHGATLEGGDASAFGFDQGGWKYISLSDYVVQGQDGMQSISIPIADLITAGLDMDALASFLIIRFWHNDVITVDIDNITFKGKSNSSFSQPSLPNKISGATWKIQSVDTMKWSKDEMRGQEPDEEISAIVKKDERLGLTHMTIDCPYDNYSDYSPAIESGYKERISNAIRAKGMYVWHRQHFNEWEGDYDFQKITPRTTPSRALGNANDVLSGADTSSWLYLHYNYIKTHSSDFVAGDIFTPIAEVENAGYGGATTDQFSTAMEMWEFVRDLITVCNRAFADISLGDKVYIGFFGHSGYTAMNRIDEFTVDCEKFLSIDHYEFSAATMSSDLDTIIGFFDIPLHIGEWGDYQDGNEGDNATLVTDIYNVFSSKSDIFGVSYWDDIKGSYESLLNSDQTLTEKENYYAVQSFFGGVSPTPKNVSDNGNGNEVLNALIALAILDSGNASEILSILAKIAVIELGQGIEALNLSNSLGISETASGNEVLALLNSLSLSEVGVGSDIINLLKKLNLSDNGSGNEVLKLLNSLKIAETATANEVLKVLARLSLAETGNGDDNETIKNYFTLNDVGNGIETLSLKASFVLQEIANGYDNIEIKNSFKLSDLANGIDTVAIKNNVPLYEIGIGSETLVVFGSLILVENGTGAEIIIAKKTRTFLKINASITTDCKNASLTINKKNASITADRKNVSADIGFN